MGSKNDIERITVAFNMNSIREWDKFDLEGNELKLTIINKNDI